jgi:hypothetical protein
MNKSFPIKCKFIKRENVIGSMVVKADGTKRKPHWFLAKGQAEVWEHNLKEHERSIEDPAYEPEWMLFRVKRPGERASGLTA